MRQSAGNDPLEDDYIVELEEAMGGKPRDIVDFARRFLGVELYLPQRVIVKAFYSLELDEEEQKLLNSWVMTGRTNWKPGQVWKELILIAGMRGGKSGIAAVIGHWEAYKTIRLRDPARFYGLMPGDKLFIMNFAKSEEQAAETVFAKMDGIIRSMPFFQRQVETKKLVSIENGWEWPGERVVILSGHSDPNSQVGKTAKAVIFDELARFSSDPTKRGSGQLLYQSLSRAATTLGDEGKIIVVTSPMSTGDPAMQLHYMAMKRQPKGMLTFRLATWELNPRIKKEDLARFFFQDREAAERDFGANPPAAERAFFDHPELIQACFKGEADIPSPCYVTAGTKTRSIKSTGEMRDYVKLDVFDIRFNPAELYYAFGDAGTVRDSYVVAIGHGIPEPIEVTEPDGKITTQTILRPVVDLVLEWVPSKEKPVDYVNVEEVIEELARHITFRKVMFDRYNAPHLIQKLVDMGIDAEAMAFSQKAQMTIYETFKRMAYSGLVSITDRVNSVAEYDNELGVSRACAQFLKLNVTQSGKIEHPNDSGKDLADAIAGLCWLIANADAQELSNIAAPRIVSVSLKR